MTETAKISAQVRYETPAPHVARIVMARLLFLDHTAPPRATDGPSFSAPLPSAGLTGPGARPHIPGNSFISISRSLAAVKPAARGAGNTP